jgi:hypothetical protein
MEYPSGKGSRLGWGQVWLWPLERKAAQLRRRNLPGKEALKASTMIVAWFPYYFLGGSA